MSAKRSDRLTGSGRATELMAVMIRQDSFAAVAFEYELLRFEGSMVLTGLDDGEVQKLGSRESGNFGVSRDATAWRGQRDDSETSFSFRLPQATVMKSTSRF